MEKTPILQAVNTHSDSSKGQKLVAALYFVTNHLSDIDPLKNTIRSRALELLAPTTDTNVLVSYIDRLLSAAGIAGMISENNVNILIQEMNTYAASAGSPDIFAALFSTPEESSKTTKVSNMSFMSNKLSLKSPSDLIPMNKSKRQIKILSFINDRKSAGIKDISSLFPEVSEKTIQRELSSLVETGKILKRGSKRWSMYMSVV